MKEKIGEATRKGGPVRGLLTVLVSAAVFLAFLVGVTAFISFAMS